MKLHSVDEVEEFINENGLAILFISSPGCSVCQALLPRMEDIVQKYPAVQLGYVDGDEVQEVTGKFLAFGAPTILVFVEGKEQIREGRFIRMEDFEAKLERLISLTDY
ncbi:Thioredoxin [Terribacillus halophilus]|uniref:Thioredoxin n=1 Tax=Terribacillus halophilus TaxID=361279 RepID=A0A1G6NSG3_9BACI|nr:thioredoxin family protein [Terribacillus halophilus]SDC70217.1 Thioredoxin [Terribacillus halophilus]